ncbi:uncharacterized protein LOC143605168 [Bidens hawaiensis]|uniref:uncharacterized protein LOC143605168 n=1 Tax=Bidens hawaiensis TaxID=980011 RepID=UPI00404AB680
MRVPSYEDELDGYDSSYRPDGSFYSGDSRLPSYGGASYPRPVVRHAEYHSNAEYDFSKPYHPKSFAEKSKFIPSIATAPFPINAKIPTSVGTYNGMTDPSDHLLRFEAVGGVSGWTLPYWCHMFALTFTGAAREWFEKLPCGKITSWKDFVAKFSQHFSQQKKHTRDPSEILDVTRRNNESIEVFITRFTNESLNIGGVSEDMLRRAFCKNVHSDALIRTLTGKDGMPESWDEIMKASKLFARTEKTLSSSSQKQSPRVEFQTPRPNRQAKGPIWSRLQPSAETPKPFDARSLIGNKGKRNFSTRSTNSWTQLSKTPSEILTTENLIFRKPQPIPRKNEIEAAVKNGKLEHLVKGVRGGTGKPPAKDSQGPAKRQIKDLNVHMIQGGHLGKGKKREYLDEEWKNEPVIFPQIKGGPCNKNPLIITAEFGHYRSQYVFFDTGSTSDIMYEQCFEQLDEEDKEILQPIHAPVSGFGGEIMHPRGVITFPVTLSDRVHSITEEVEFLVLPATSKHDVILGREAIGDFNAHPSIAHGAVGVPTRTGVAIIHTRQLQ